jgi:dTDP-4-amino-4,6-dideoxygalactose transaminase
LDPIQASVLSVNLKYLDSWNLRRQEIASLYSDSFVPLGVKTLLIERESVFHHFILESENRAETRDLLESHGIKTEIHYPESAEVSFSKFSSQFISGVKLEALRLAQKTLSLPISPWMKKEQINFVIDGVRNREVLHSLLKNKD